MNYGHCIPSVLRNRFARTHTEEDKKIIAIQFKEHQQKMREKYGLDHE